MTTMMMCVALLSAPNDAQLMQTALHRVQALATADANAQEPFVPTITFGPTGEHRRHTPMVRVGTPWSAGETFDLETPEYVWARVPGVRSRGPFFYGRPIGAVGGPTAQFPSLEPPQWKRRADGGIELATPITGVYVQRFRVIPHDRLWEVHFGVTNGSDKPLEHLRCQLCLRATRVRMLQDGWPTSCKFFCGGEVVAWDSLGQDISWIEPHRDARTGRFRDPCFFEAPLVGHEPPGQIPDGNRHVGNVPHFINGPLAFLKLPIGHQNAAAGC